MRKIIVYIATSADGFIARKDGAVDWLDRPRTAGDYGMGKFYKSIDTILWGRKTYDMVLKFQEEGKDYPDIAEIKNYAFSRHPPRKVARLPICKRTDQEIRRESAGTKRKGHLDDGRRRHHRFLSGRRGNRRVH